MRIAILLVLSTLCGSASAEQQLWEFAYVMRSTDLVIHHGHGGLERTSAGLAGVLKSTEAASYQITIKLRGDQATATFWPLESDTGAQELRGTFQQLMAGGQCWQTIQVLDGSQSFMLARNVPRCEP